VDITPDGSRVYTVNYVDGLPGTGTSSVIDTATNTLVATIPGFFGPFGLAIAPNGRRAYVTNFGSNDFSPFGTTVSVVDLRTNTIRATVEVGIQPAGVAVTPDSRFVLVTNFNSLYAHPNFQDLTPGQGTVSVIDARRNKLVPPTVDVGEGPHAVVLRALCDGSLVGLVSNFTYNSLSVLSLREFPAAPRHREPESSGTGSLPSSVR